MSKIDELIQDLCPDGVKFLKLDESASIKRGRRVTKNELTLDGAYPVYSGGVTPMGYYDKFNQSANTITVVKYGTAGFVNFIEEEFWANDVCYCVTPQDFIDNKYLFYVLKDKQKLIQSQATDAIPAHLPTEVIGSVQIPIPPLEVQKEIVNILDKFTQLEAELEAELEARKKQYSHYLNKILTFGNEDGIRQTTLGEVGVFIRGNGLQKKDFTESGVGCIHYGQIFTYYGTYTEKTKSFISIEKSKKARKAKTGNLVIATTSENDEDVCKAVAWLGGDDIAVSNDAMIYDHSENPKYMSYLFQTEDFLQQKRKFISGTKVKRVSSQNLAKIDVSLPPLEEQNRIVSILDKFDKLVNDISEGLPAEIAARRKQYEYYRTKLLTFEELGNG